MTINCAAFSIVTQIMSLDLFDNMFASAVKPTKKIKIIEYIKQIQQCIKVSCLSVFKEYQQPVCNIPLSCLYPWYHTYDEWMNTEKSRTRSKMDKRVTFPHLEQVLYHEIQQERKDKGIGSREWRK